MQTLRDLTFCHDEACQRANQCQRFTERHSRKWASHVMSLRPVGGDGRDCVYYLPTPDKSPERR